MGIQESLAILKRVQEIDREIYQIRQELLSIPEAVRRLTEEFEAEKSHMAQLETKLKEIQLRQKKKEGELNEKESLIRKYDSQLSQVKTNKEYSALQQEIASLKADGSIVAWGCPWYYISGQCDVPSPNSGFVDIAARGDQSLAIRGNR